MAEAFERDQATEEAPLPRAEREVLEVAAGVLARCEGGLDASALKQIEVALLRVVAFDRIAIHIEDEARRVFWVLWRDTVGAETQVPAFAPGIHTMRDGELLGLVRQRSAGAARLAPVVVEDVAEAGNAVDRALYRTGVRSYLLVPLVSGAADVGWMTIAHYVRGVPSKSMLPLLTQLGRVLGPALVRSREVWHARLFATLIDTAPDGMIALDPAGTIIEANRSALTMVGGSRAETLGRTIGEVLGSEVANALGAPWREATKTLALAYDAKGAAIAVDAVIAKVGGMSDAAFQIHLRDARAQRAAEDATARRVQQFAFLRGLSESMAGDLRVQTALERATTFCAARSDVGGVVMFRAEGAETLRLMVARGVNERTSHRLALITHADLEKMLESPSADVKRVHGVVEAVGAAIDPETTGVVPRWKILVPLTHARRPLGAMLILGKPGATLTESERELWESVAGTISAALHAAEDFEHVVALEAEKRQLVDNLPVIVARLDPKTGATLFVNEAIQRVLGFVASEVLGTPGWDGLFADPIEWEASAVARDRAARGKESTWQDRRYRHKDGRLLMLRESVYPVRDAAGVVRAIEVLAYDVTTELETRKQLMQADRLASLGAMAGGIAHEINNPVAFIGLAVGQIVKSLDDRRGDPEAALLRAKELLHEIGEASARIANIVGELKLFTRIPEGAHVTPVDINRIVQMAVTLTSAELRRRARLEMNLGELPLVPGEYASLGQAFVNLLLNAAQAVEAKHGAGGPPSFVRVSTFTENGAIVVRVSDTGVGIEPRVLPRIFDPFFKTKAAGDGAGLGLAIAHNLVRRVGGDIRVTSEVGDGSTFEVVLPLEPTLDVTRGPTPSGAMRAAPPVATPGAARGRVLIIDDEQALAKALARQLADRWDVDTVSTARDALAELAVHRYDVVVCDLRMPDQSGPAIYEATRARSQRQAARFIFTTGGSYGQNDDEIHQRAESSGRPILEKPFDGASFEALVARVAAETDT